MADLNIDDIDLTTAASVVITITFKEPTSRVTEIKFFPTGDEFKWQEYRATIDMIKSFQIQVNDRIQTIKYIRRVFDCDLYGARLFFDKIVMPSINTDLCPSDLDD